MQRMPKSKREPSALDIGNAIRAAQKITTRSSATAQTVKKHSKPKPTTKVSQIKQSPRIRAQTTRQKGKLTVQQRTNRAKTMVRLMAQKGRHELKGFLAQSQNSTKARKEQLVKDAKRLIQGFALRAQGRPRFFGGKDFEQHFVNEVHKLASHNQNRDNTVINELLTKTREKVVAETTPSNPFATPSRTTLWRLKKQLLKHGSSHSKTNARIVAEQSQRNFISFAALLGAVHNASGRETGVAPELFFSQDFTRLVVGEDPKSIQWLPKDWTDIENMPTGVNRTEKRVIAVALQATLMADGGAAPFLIYVKAPSMKDGEQKIIPLKRVGVSLGLGEVAYLVVDNKRKVRSVV